MIWSRFNILYTNNIGEYFLYNSRKNMFIKIEKELFLLFKEIENDEMCIEKLSTEQIKVFSQKKNFGQQ